MLYGDKMLNDESNQRTLTATINYIKKHLLRLRLSVTLKKTQRFEQVLFEIFQGNPFYRSGRKLENRGNHANDGNSS